MLVMGNQRENSKWNLIMITNFIFNVSKGQYVIGKPPLQFPKPVLDKARRSMILLDATPRRKQTKYRDNLCLFRCIALSNRHHSKLPLFTDLRKEVTKLYRKWYCYKKKKIEPKSKKFKGIKYWESKGGGRGEHPQYLIYGTIYFVCLSMK